MRTLMLALLCLPLAATASDRVYTWTDEHGVTHYSDSPPPSRQYESRRIQAQDPPPAEDDQDAGATLLEPDPARADNCERARANLRTLQSAPIVRMDLDGDGEKEEIGPAERARQIELTIGHIREFCDE